MQLTTLDQIAAAMDRPARPLDWAIVLHLPRSLELTALEAGARSARLTYPSSGAVRDGAIWHPLGDAPVIDHRVVTPASLRDMINQIVDAPRDITRSATIVQHLLTGPELPNAILVTRVHHALADLVGGTLWLRHQLEVALEIRSAEAHDGAFSPPSLRVHPHLERKSVYSFRGPSDRLARDRDTPSAIRRWQTLSFDAAPLRSAAAKEGVTYNDVLAACAIETYRSWNARRAPAKAQKIGLWIPTNIRASALEGFGNGTSRIRVYNRYDSSASLIDKARAIRMQMQWSREHGEWALPSLALLDRLPAPLIAPLLRGYFNRPWVDMATGPFSHAERSTFDDLPIGLISHVELLGTLDTRHPFGVFAMTLNGTTHASFVFDPGQLRDASAAELTRLFMSMVEEASQ